MNDQELQKFTELADSLNELASEQRAGVEGLVKETIKARDDAFTILTPAARGAGSSTMSDAAHSAIKDCLRLNERLVFLTTKADGIAKVHQSAVNEVSHLSYQLSTIEDARPVLSAAAGERLAAFRRAYRLTMADWTLHSSNAVLQLHSVLQSYHRLLLAFVKHKPGKRFDFGAASKEAAGKVRDALKDGLTFPGYSKLEKVIKALRTPPAQKEAEALLKAATLSERLDALNRGLSVLKDAFDYSEEMINMSGKALISSSDVFDNECESILTALRKR
jgi:hypothetical protein